MAARNLNTRVDLLEQALKTVAGTLIEIRDEIKSDRQARNAEMLTIRQELGTKSSGLPFKEIVASALITVTLFGSIMGGANWWFSTRQQPVVDKLMVLEQSLAAQPYAVLKYRLDQLEAVVNKEKH